MEQAKLYDDGHYRLDVQLRTASGRIVVFFPHRHATGPWDADSPPRRDYGGSFAARYGMNAAIVGMARSDWYQCDRFPRLLGVLQRMSGCFSQVAFVGSSMGGYGAIAAASAIGADHVIAYSPVSCIDPGTVGDNRYVRDFGQMGELRAVSRHKATRYTMIFDPADVDARHVQRFRLPADRTEAIHVTGAGHLTQRVLQEAGLLSRVTREILSQEGLTPETRGLLRYAKREAPAWLANMFRANLARRPDVAAWALDRLKETGVFAHKYPRFERRLSRVRRAA